MKNYFQKVTTMTTLVLCLAACSQERNILSEGISSINGKIALFSYQQKYDSLDTLDDYASFVSLDDLPSSIDEPTAFFFDCRATEFNVPIEILDQLYGYFDSPQYVYILFYKAPDFSFFAHSRFDNEKHNYVAGSETLNYFYNDATPGYVNSGGYTLASPEKDGEEKMMETLISCLAIMVKSNREKL